MKRLVKRRWYLWPIPLLCLFVQSYAFAAGGNVALITDNTADGYYYSLTGSGVDRFIGEYLAGDFDPGAVICGARVRELNQGSPPFGTMGGDLRAEDGANPGYPDLGGGGLIATVDAGTVSTCSTTSAIPRIFTFGGGGGVPDVAANKYISAIEPTHGAGPLDFCGVLLDTSSSPQGRSKVYSGGAFGSLPWNHFVELIVFVSARMDLNIRASGTARFPGHIPDPIVITTRPNSGGAVTDDNITVTAVIDNGTGGAIGRNFRICADQSVINPKKGLKEITGFFRPVGGGPAIMNPTVLPTGRTILRLEVSAASVKAKAASIVNKLVLNLPLRVLVDDPAADTSPCALDGGADVDDETQLIGLRRQAGSVDDNSAEAFFVVQVPNVPGDAPTYCLPALRLSDIAYTVTGIEVVGGEFGGSGLPGLDALEIRTEDPVFTNSPDLTAAGLVRAFGAADGVGSAPLGPPPTTAVFNIPDYFFDPTGLPPGLIPNRYLLALLLPGESSPVTAVGGDTAPGDTLLGQSSFIMSGQLPATPFPGVNWMLRMLLDGDRGTLADGPGQATLGKNAVLRDVNHYVAIDAHGRRL